MKITVIFFQILLTGICAAGIAAGEEAGDAGAFNADSELDIVYGRTDIQGEKLELGLTDLVEKTLQNNFDVRIERLNVPLSELALDGAAAIYVPVFGSSLDYNKSLKQATTSLQGARLPEEQQWMADLYFSQLLPTGANYKFGFGNTRFETNDTNSLLNPRYDTSLRLDISQPLLRNFGTDVNNAGIHQAENSVKIAEQQYRAGMMSSLKNAINLYWELTYNLMDLRVRQVSLQQARKLLEENKAKLKAGAIPRTDVLQAEAGVAERSADLLRVKANIADIEDELKRMINAENEQNLSDWELPVVPLTEPAIVTLDVDEKKSMTLAREFRPDYQTFVLELKNRNIELDYRDNQLWPKLDLRLFGELAGNDKKYSGAFDNATSGRYYNAGAGLTFEIPLSNAARRSQYKAAELQLRQTNLQFEKLKQNVVVEIRRVIRDLRTARAEIDSNDVLRRAQLRKLEAERQRFEAGKITSFDVLVFQEQFAIAQRKYIRSVIDYNQALINLHQVQGTLLEYLDVQISY